MPNTALTPAQINALMPQLNPVWQVNTEHTKLMRSVSFNDFYATMAFVNALAFIAHHEHHHPDLTLGYNYCHITFMTHSLNGLSAHDFICAAKVDALLASTD